MAEPVRGAKITAQKCIPRSVWYGLDGTGYNNIAQELKSENHLLRKWISLYAIYKYQFTNDPHQYYDFIHQSKNSRYALVIFTIPTETLETSDGVDDRDITIVKIETMDSEAEINTILANLDIDPELFTTPWRCEYPL
ncbi:MULTISPECIES: hypothetical protein [Pseudomonas]|uniref:hypothetical protein n=1 Tax=Pseudomonas TaxID=286 RepID=UPI001F36F315|nr:MULTISPECIES: hypothetical protein [Pseudomonas]MCX4218938.1 hypothetical protein [Pseudomonas sp. MCal1]UIN53202.1 hypothetical protein LXN51_19770 [Pseudomonas kribbensis]